MSEQTDASRRKFLVGAGMAAGAVAVAGTGLITPKNAEAAYVALPWQYAPLDLAVVKRRAYDKYFISGCMYAAGGALLETLVETVGAPWDTIPQDMFKYGGGGVYSWGTTCGALNGCAWIIQACAGTNAANVISDLFQWYCGYPFPSRDHEAYAKFTRVKTTVSNSPLCHASVSKWCYTTRNKVNSDQKKDRCAKLAADVAGKTAELLNTLFAGGYVPVFVQPDASCSGCHVGINSTLDNVQMKSTCTTYCHTSKTSTHY